MYVYKQFDEWVAVFKFFMGKGSTKEEAIENLSKRLDERRARLKKENEQMANDISEFEKSLHSKRLGDNSLKAHT